MKEREQFDAAFHEIARDKAGIKDKIRKAPRNPNVISVSSGVLLEGLGGVMMYLGASVHPFFILGAVFPAGVGIALLVKPAVFGLFDKMSGTGVESFNIAYGIAKSRVSKVLEEQRDSPSREQVEALLKKIFYLPPVGGKVTLEKKSLRPASLFPVLTADEKVEEIIRFRQEGKLDETYVHQLTVQGRLPDEFKYAALALTINSTYRSDWRKPLYEAPWGKVAPLVHDGGHVQTINPFWSIRGRTDFIQRVATV